MAKAFEICVDVAATPDAAWALAGDPARVGEWFPPVVACRLDGDLRTVTMGNGAVVVERIVEHDDVRRSYSYSVERGIPGLVRHRATISVTPAPGGSRVTWSQNAVSEQEGYDAEARLSGVMTEGLERLRDVLEGVGGGD